MISVGVNCFTVQLHITGYAPNGLRVKFDIESQGQSTPKFNQILTMIRCIFGPNLVILGRTGDELLRGNAQNVVKLEFKVKFDLEGQGQSTPKSNQI